MVDVCTSSVAAWPVPTTRCGVISDTSKAAPPPRRPSATLLEEERLLHERIVQRDDSALLEYLDRMGHVLYCAALMHTGDTTAAEALTEELFIDLWQEPEAFNPAHGPAALQLLERMARRWNAAESSRGSVSAEDATGVSPQAQPSLCREAGTKG